MDSVDIHTHEDIRKLDAMVQYLKSWQDFLPLGIAPLDI